MNTPSSRHFEVGSGPEEFPRFSRLPAELRLKIWADNLPGPRIVTIRCSSIASPTPSSACQGYNDDAAPRFTSSAPIPANLHACRESRWEAMRRYRLLFATCGESGRIFFDPMADILYFGARDGDAASESQLCNFMALIRFEEMACLRYIAINEMLIPGGRTVIDGATVGAAEYTVEDVMYHINLLFPFLKQLFIVCGDKNPVYSPDSVLAEPNTPNRLIERRVNAAIRSIQREQVGWTPPQWTVRVIASSPTRPQYTESLLGWQEGNSFHDASSVADFTSMLSSWRIPHDFFGLEAMIDLRARPFAF
ncbi:hypothetical protein DL764_010041 [Monosporascus ibericus]|uniref:2EXR domain-containing protein n=1 Tax=Monosporascus ibericus TaxID=155417 RepID=A0A4Q4STG2_9PEZI|nr:hypothetical protein DL764_010041 [Monosporascus ibericus]